MDKKQKSGLRALFKFTSWTDTGKFKAEELEEGITPTVIKAGEIQGLKEDARAAFLWLPLAHAALYCSDAIINKKLPMTSIIPSEAGIAAGKAFALSALVAGVSAVNHYRKLGYIDQEPISDAYKATGIATLVYLGMVLPSGNYFGQAGPDGDCSAPINAQNKSVQMSPVVTDPASVIPTTEDLNPVNIQ